MCQPKSKGGKRCLKHAKVSQYVIRSVVNKFGVNEKLAADTLSELNREGKDLPVASGTEALAFVDQESFIVSSDQELSEHERKIQLNQLAKARTEVKDGVSGSHLHAWKNLAKRVASKMRKLAFVGLLVPGLALTSCSGGHITTPSTSPSASSPSASQSAAPSQTPATSTPASNASAIPGSGQKVTDKLGEYEKAAPVKATVNSDALDPSAKSTAGFSDSQIKSAEEFISNFVSTQVIDSSAVDTGEAGWQQWIEANKSKYFTAADANGIVANYNGKRSTVIFTTPPADTTFVRDGGVREASEKIFIQDVEGFNDAYKRLQIGGAAQVEYRVSPEVSISALKAAHPDASEAELKKKFPKAFNGTEDVLKFNLTYLYSVKPNGDSWLIGGYSNQFHTEYSYR